MPTCETIATPTWARVTGFVFTIEMDGCLDGIGHIERVSYDKPDVWTIRFRGDCLNRNLRWEFEPSPSDRTDAFKARTRYTLEEAFSMAEKIRRQALAEGAAQELKRRTHETD